MRTAHCLCLFSLIAIHLSQAESSLSSPTKERLALAADIQRQITDYQAQTDKSYPPAKLRVVYFTPKATEPQAGYRERLTRILTDVSQFFRDEMLRNGFKCDGLPLEMENGQVKLHEVKGVRPASGYKHESGDLTEREIRHAMRGVIDCDREFVLVLYSMCRKNEDGSYYFYAPYYGKAGSNHVAGFCHAADCELLDPSLLTETTRRITYEEHYGQFKKTLADFNTAYLGGIAHELGHGLSLPHDCEIAAEKAQWGTSLMGGGNQTYRGERWKKRPNAGAFLTLATCIRLAAHPIMTQGSRDRFTPLSCQVTGLTFSSAPGRLTVRGRVQSNIPACAVIAYCDPASRPGDYDAIPFSAPVRNGTFEIEATEHRPGQYALRLAVIHVNGAVHQRSVAYTCNDHGVPQVTGLADALELASHEEQALQDPSAELLALTDEKIAQAATPAAKSLLRHLRNLLKSAEPTLVDPATTTGSSLWLSEAKWTKAEVGWGQPERNRMGGRPEIVRRLFLKLGTQYFEKGLYAHSPSSYQFHLAGKWKRFTAQAGPQSGDNRAARFIVRGDGRELFRSASVPPGQSIAVDLDITGVQDLELVTQGGDAASGQSWSIWAEPKVAR